jgi:hypothetical protein
MKAMQTNNKSTKILVMLARAGGVAALVLGFTAWSGLKAIVPVHIAFGALLVIAVWGLGIQVRGQNAGLTAAAALLGLIIPILGLTQSHFAVAGHHALFRLLHILAGVGGIGLAEVMAKRIKTTET